MAVVLMSTAACGAPAPEVASMPTTATTLAGPSATDGAAGPQTTGVPTGVTLTASGPLEVTTPGTVIDGLDIAGCVVVAADDVTIKNSRITCVDGPAHRAVTASDGVTGLLIEDTEIDGGGVLDIGVDVNDVMLRRLDIHHVNDGVRMGSRIVVEDSWIHDLSRQGELHPDAIQGISAQDVVIRGNTLDPRNPATGDLGNAAIMLGSETGTKLSRNVVIEDNVLDGGNYTLNIRDDIDAEDFTITGNKFGAGSRYGPVITPGSVTVGVDNVMAATGEVVDVDRPQ